MDVTAALIAGLAAGLAIAMQVGAVSLLVVETAVAGGAAWAWPPGSASPRWICSSRPRPPWQAARPAPCWQSTRRRSGSSRRPRSRRSPSTGSRRCAAAGAESAEADAEVDGAGAARPLPALPRDHLGQPADDRLVRRRRHFAAARRPRRRDGVRRRCGRRVRGLAPRAHGGGRPRRPVDHPARAARARRRRPGRGPRCSRRTSLLSVMTASSRCRGAGAHEVAAGAVVGAGAAGDGSGDITRGEPSVAGEGDRPVTQRVRAGALVARPSRRCVRAG